MNDTNLVKTWWGLRLTYGLIPIVAGLDKFTNFLVDWKKYLNPAALDIVPMSAATFMHVVGIIEVVAGLLVLSRLTRFGGYLVSAWLTGIAINLITMGYYDIAVRDLAMAIGAFSLAQLTESATHDGVPAQRERRRMWIGTPAQAGV